MVAMMPITCGSRGGNPMEITDKSWQWHSPGTGVHTSTPNSCPKRWQHCCWASPTVALSAGSIVAGHLETPAGAGLGAREETDSSFQPSPEATAVHKLGMGMGMWAEDSLPSQRLFQGPAPPHPHSRLRLRVPRSGEKCMVRAQVLDSGRPGLQP